MSVTDVADGIQIGDVVRKGKGKVLWVVVGFGTFTGDVPYAELRPVEGYTGASATLDKLALVSKADQHP